MKSFQTVEEKLSESEFFLSKLEEVGPNIFQARCYFSAFVSAARSVTFVLQTVMIQNKDFQSWYKIEIAKLGGTNYGKFFVDRRNEVIHEGETRINSGYYKRNSKTGTRISKLYFSTMDPSNPLEIVEENVISMSKKYLVALQNLVQDCRNQFPEYTDFDWIFNLENLVKKKMDVEDLEEILGFPRGWTEVEGIPAEERLRMLKDSASPASVQFVLEKIRKDNH